MPSGPPPVEVVHTAAVTSFPDPADLYPDVVRRGSLAAALQASAAEQGLSLGDVTANEMAPLRYAGIPSTTALRQPLGVSAGHRERYWSIEGWGEGICLVSGHTTDLAAVARAAHAWREGLPLREMRRHAPFVELSRRADAAAQGPAEVVAAEWQELRDDAAKADWPEYLALIEAAYAEPRLRRLYPYTSHWTLRFSTTTGMPFSPDLVCLSASRGNDFSVRESWTGQVLGQTATAAEAVALAVGRLPADLGAAESGMYQEQAG